MGVQVSFSIWHSDIGIPNYIKKFSEEVRLFEIKYLKTKTKTQDLEIYMEFSLKIGLLSVFFFFFPFFLQGYIEMKMKIKE